MNCSVTVAILVFVCASQGRVVFAQTQVAERLLLEVVEADRLNRERMVNYLFRETVSVHYKCVSRSNLPDQLKTYEMILVEGEPYFQLLEDGGQPISEKQARKEQARMKKVAANRQKRRAEGKQPQPQSGRTGYPYHRLPEFHVASIRARENWNGNRVVVLETTPKPGAVGNTQEELILACSTTRLWLDAQTKRPLKAEVRMIEKAGKWPKGMILQVENAALDEGWIPARLYSYRPLVGIAGSLANCKGVEVEQTMSKFRKFTAESKFYWGDVVPEQ